MVYGSWGMDCNRQNSLAFWMIFCLFIPLTTCKIKILKNENNAWRCYYFTHVYHKSQSYDVWFLRYGVWQTVFFVILDHLLPFTQKNQNFEKMRNRPGDTIILHKCTKNYDLMKYSFWDMVQNGLMDRWKKWHIEVGTPPKNKVNIKLNMNKVKLNKIKMKQLTDN